jgi:hypothetical protein
MFTKKQYLVKNNLHHAYLIEGSKEETTSEILEFFKGDEVIQITLDSLKIDDARNLKSLTSEKTNTEGKKVFIITTNSILREAQNTLLKVFEEPIENTHFFVVMPNKSALLSTFVSRFFVIQGQKDMDDAAAQKFIKLPAQKRIDFLKELLAEPEEEDLIEDSTRTKALRFLDSLEVALHQHLGATYVECFEHIFKVRKFLRQPGSSAKSLLESVALIIPN